jgi:hypothetical protein
MQRQHPLIREGLIAGALGAVSVALWFLLIDLVRGRIFFTPAALGSAFFHGAKGVDEVQVTAATVLGYTFIHIVVFMAIGFLAARLMTSADEEPRVLLGAGVAFMVTEVAAIGLLTLLATWLLDALSLWTVLIANLIAAAVIGVYLYRAHPQARRDLQTNLEERDLHAPRASAPRR